jgi:hypothetical protein
VEAHSELQGEKWVSLKTPMDVPAITWSREFHSPRSYQEMEVVLARPRSGSTF